MRSSRLLILISVMTIALFGCAPGANAEDPAEAISSPTVETQPAPPRVYPTSTPWPQFGPPLVSAAQVTATAQLLQNSPDDVDATPVAPTSSPTATPSTVPTPTRAVPIPTEIPTATPPDRSGTYVPSIPVSYPPILDWEKLVGDDEIVVLHASREARVTVREHRIDRELVRSIDDLEASAAVSDFIDWSDRAISDSVLIGPHSLRREFGGTWLTDQAIAVVDMHIWGELAVEVAIESTAKAWTDSTNIRSTALFIAESFRPDFGTTDSEAWQVSDAIEARFSSRPSGIYIADPGGGLQTQLTCKEVRVSLLSDPLYIAAGEWQVHAATLQGVQVWSIFEPGFSIVESSRNISAC